MDHTDYTDFLVTWILGERCILFHVEHVEIFVG